MKLEEVRVRFHSAWSNVSIATYLFVVLFGTGSWVAVNGIWVELPIIVQHIPESWTLPSYLTVIIQLANIGPLIFTLGNKFFPRVFREPPAIFIILSIGALACALLAFFWKETIYVAGAERSLALLILAFFVSMVDCTSSVTFLPFMAVFREAYMSPFFVGEGLSGLLPSLVALGQGVGAGASHQGCVAPTSSPVYNSTSNGTRTNGTSSDESWGPGPKFSTYVFFWFLCGMMVASGLAFLGLNTLSFAKRQRVDTKDQKSDGEKEEALQNGEHEMMALCSEEENVEGDTNEDSCVNSFAKVDTKDQKLDGEKEETLKSGEHEMMVLYNEEENLEEDTKEDSCVASYMTVFLLVVLAVINGLSNGVIPAIQSYACIPYSYYIYHLTLTLSAIANPVTCFIFPLIRTKSVAILTLLSVIYCAMCSYIVVVASQSPNVLLRCDVSGAVLMVLISVLAISIVTYTKVAIGALMRKQGRKGLLWYGISTQVGSCIGALCIFAPVNIYHVFKQF